VSRTILKLKDGVLTLDHGSIADFAGTLSEKLRRPILKALLRALEFQLPVILSTETALRTSMTQTQQNPSVAAAIQSAMVERLGLQLENESTGLSRSRYLASRDPPSIDQRITERNVRTEVKTASWSERSPFTRHDAALDIPSV